MLIGHGANDVRCKVAESDQIVAAMVEKNIPVIYVVFPDEGHDFARPENSIAFNAIAEAFLARHLGGRCEPIGEDFMGSAGSPHPCAARSSQSLILRRDGVEIGLLAVAAVTAGEDCSGDAELLDRRCD
jgi:hypothetical protein